MTGLTLQVLAMVLPPLLILEAFFSGSEIALLSADKLALRKLAKQGKHGAQRALELASHPEKVLSTTLLMTSFSVVTQSALIALYFNSQGYEHAELYSVLLASPIIVIFGELLPKTFFQRHSTEWAPWVARPMNWVYWIFFPFTRSLTIYTTKLSRIVGPIEELLSGRKRNTREELVSMLNYGKRESEIKSSERKIIRRILDFKDSEAKHALIPLVKIEAIEVGATVREALERFERHRHSRMPVFNGRITNIVGVLETSDLMSMSGTQDLEQPIRHAMSPAHYVADAQSLEDVLLDMRHEDTEMVVVVDEHGGAVGILTFEDILEEIVGEISDEYDTESLPFRILSGTSWLVQARMEISQINEVLKLDIPVGEYETLGGFLLQQFGRIPDPRDELFFNTSVGALKFTIRAATERQIESVLVEKLS